MIFLSVFISNAAVLILEIVGARALIPFLGSSVETWAGILSAVICGLAIGYWGGGYIADKNPTRLIELLGISLAAAGLVVIAFWSGSDSIAVWGTLVSMYGGVSLAAAFVSIPLLLLPSVFLAAASPLAAKILIPSMAESATTVGKLSAIAAVGSVVGSLGVALLFIPHFGSRAILLTTGAVLLLTALALSRKSKEVVVILLCCVASLVAGTANVVWAYQFSDMSDSWVLEDRDSRYGRIIVTENKVGTPVHRTIRTGPFGVQCGAEVREDGTVIHELVYPYLRTFDIGLTLVPKHEKLLMLGGCNYSYPMHLANRSPQAKIDVVEIDPTMTELAKKWFGFVENGAIVPKHTDARFFLHTTEEKYDVVFADAFGVPLTIPFELLTQEAFTEIRNVLTEDGVLVVNIVGSVLGPGDAYVGSTIQTIASVFPHTVAYQIDSRALSDLQNIIVLASVSTPLPTEPTVVDPHTHILYPIPMSAVSENSMILTDDYAPTEALAKPMRDAIFRWPR